MFARAAGPRLMVAVFVAAMAWATAAQPTPTMRVQVDCARGESIGFALTLGDERKPMEVVVAGTCRESVIVARSDVTLRAAFPGSGIVGPDAAIDAVTVTGRRVTIDGLTISGGHDGVHGSSAAGLVLRNTTISGTGRTGVYLGAGSSGVLDRCTVRDNPRDGVALDASSGIVLASVATRNGRFGIIAVNNAAGRIGIDAENVPSGNVAVTANGAAGIMASLGGSLWVAMTEASGNGTDPLGLARVGIGAAGGAVTLIGGNTVADNASTGVNASRGGVINVGDPSFGLPIVNTITGNGRSGGAGGVFAFMGSTLNVQGAVITGNYGFGLGLSLKSQGQLASSTIQGSLPPGGDGIRLLLDSGLFVAPGTSTNVSGNAGWGLQCLDGESSVVNTFFLSFTPGNGSGPSSPTCTGF